MMTTKNIPSAEIGTKHTKVDVEELLYTIDVSDEFTIEEKMLLENALEAYEEKIT